MASTRSWGSKGIGSRDNPGKGVKIAGVRENVFFN
jgi:hypothetical protein